MLERTLRAKNREECSNLSVIFTYFWQNLISSDTLVRRHTFSFSSSISCVKNKNKKIRTSFHNKLQNSSKRKVATYKLELEGEDLPFSASTQFLQAAFHAVLKR